MKKALARDLRKAQTDDWAARLDKVIHGQNSNPKPDYLEGAEPNEVTLSLELQQMLEKRIKHLPKLTRSILPKELGN